MVSERCKNMFAIHFSFWKHLTVKEQEDFCKNISVQKYKKGEHVHNGSNDCEGVLFIKAGHLRVYMLSDEGREVTLFRLFEGDTCILSASCVLSNITFDVFIDAEDDSEVLLLNSSFFDKLLNNNVYVENFTYKLMTKRFSDVMWAMQQILFISFDKRLAHFLLDKFDKNNLDKIKITHEQIAKYLGSAREVVSRMLKYFESEGIVKLLRGSIKLINKEKLKELAN